jgi:hypothetical protein
MFSKYKIGEEVTFDGVTYYEITDIKEEQIETMSKGTLIFTRLYFGDKHKPEWSHNVKGRK